MHPITVGAAGHGLVGAGSVIGLCPRSLGYALTAWALHSWCTIGDFIGIFHGKIGEFIGNNYMNSSIFHSKQVLCTLLITLGAKIVWVHTFFVHFCLWIHIIFCMNSFFVWIHIFMTSHTHLCKNLIYSKTKTKNRAGDSNHDPNTFYQTLPTTTPSSPYLAAIFCIISLYYIIIWFSRARKWCRQELK